MTDFEYLPSDAEIDRDIGLRGSLYDFVKMAWHLVEPGEMMEENWHIELICQHLEDIAYGRTRNEIINLPPGHMKSLLVSVFWQAWAWIRFPGLRFIVASFDASLTARDAKKVIAIVTSPWYKERWGDIVILPPKCAITDFSNTAGGFRFSTSVRGKVTGRHCDIFIVDDPVKPLEVTGEALELCIRWWKETVATRFRKLTTSRRVIIMQRLHDNDLVGYILAEEKNQDWKALVLPAEFDSKTPSEGDPRTEDGELLWPGHVPRDELVKLKFRLGGIASAAQLQQNPVPAGGGIFKAEWLQNYWHVLPAKFDSMVCSWDCAFKGTDDSDFVVGQVWGRKGADFYLVAQVRGRKSFTETCSAFLALAQRFPRAIAKLVEDKANGSAVIDTFQKRVPGIVPVNPEGGKEARANAAQPLFEAGNVYLPDPTMDGCEWVDLDYKPELQRFPRGKNDDQVDATTQALLYLYKRKSPLADAMKKVREAARPA